MLHVEPRVVLAALRGHVRVGAGIRRSEMAVLGSPVVASPVREPHPLARRHVGIDERVFEIAVRVLGVAEADPPDGVGMRRAGVVVVDRGVGLDVHAGVVAVVDFLELHGGAPHPPGTRPGTGARRAERLVVGGPAAGDVLGEAEAVQPAAVRIFQGLVERGRVRRGPEIAVVVDVELSGRAQLLQIGYAARAVRPFARGLQRREQHRRQNRDDRDHDQKFDQREGPIRRFLPVAHCSFPPFR